MAKGPEGQKTIDGGERFLRTPGLGGAVRSPGGAKETGEVTRVNAHPIERSSK
jgi:hypothetical protein